MIHGHPTLHELLNAPPGTVFQERRYGEIQSFGGSGLRASFGGAPRGTAAELRSRLAAREAEIRESDEKIDQRFGVESAMLRRHPRSGGRDRRVNGAPLIVPNGQTLTASSFRRGCALQPFPPVRAPTAWSTRARCWPT
jgi:hypothetical protein